MAYEASPFVLDLRNRCIKKPLRLGLPESQDPRVIDAIDRLLQESAVSEIHTLTSKQSFSNAATLLQKEHLTDDPRLVHADDPSYDFHPDDNSPLLQAGALLDADRIDAALAGAIHTTADVIRAAIRKVGLGEHGKTISGSFFMTREKAHQSTHRFLFADCGVVIEPTLAQLKDISRASLHTWEQIIPDTPPVVAFLSFSTKGSAKHPASEKMAEAAEWFKATYPAIPCEGEMQFDAAFDPEIGKRKCPDSTVPGKANIFIFPNLDAGNLVYKVAQRLGGFEAYGPILQGARKPFSDLSRGATSHDIAVSAYINLLRSGSL